MQDDQLHRHGLQRIDEWQSGSHFRHLGFSRQGSAAGLVERHRLAAQVTLHLITAFTSQKVPLRLGLDAFGDNRQLQAMGKGDHRAGDRAVLGVAWQATHKTLVDLQLVERQTLQVGKRGIAGTESRR
jgi:hypothetical protein